MMKLSLSLFAGALAILPTTSFAQTRSRVVITQVKPEMMNEWIMLQRDVVLPAAKKAGLKSQTVFGGSPFGRLGEYVVVQPLASMADYDGQNPLVKALGQPGAARLTDSLRKCTSSQYAYMSTRWDDASNITDTPPRVIISARYRIAAGKAADVRAIIKSDVLPVYKKGNVYFTVSSRGPGANPSDITMITGYSKFGDWDGGPYLTKALGADAANRINAKMNGMRTLIEVVVRTRNADLSF